MDISAINSGLQEDVQILMLKKSMQQQQTTGNAIVQSMNQITPPSGNRLDITA